MRKWQEKLTQLGFEFIPQSREIETPVIVEPVKAENPEPESGDVQLTLFGEPVPIEKAEKKERPTMKPSAVSLTAPTPEMLDCILRAGSNEIKSIERIIAQFQKGKSSAENTEFLRREFDTGGRGYKYAPDDENPYAAERAKKVLAQYGVPLDDTESEHTPDRESLSM